MVAPIPFNDKWRAKLPKLVLAVAEGHAAAVSPNQPKKERQPDHPAAALQATAARLPLSFVSGNSVFSTTTTGISYYLLTGNYGNAGHRIPAPDS